MKKVYTDTVEEYRVLRGGTGLVDYAGAGLFVVSGPQAAALLGRTFTRSVDFLLEGQISTALLLADDGTVLAEGLVHCRGAEYLVEVWPAQAEAARDRLTDAATGVAGVTLADVSHGYRVLGIEGPESFRIVQKFLSFPVASMAYRSFVNVAHDSTELQISRTGVTGEYGYKLLAPAGQADELRAELIALGARECGLDAVDICRMETRFVNLEREQGSQPVTPFELGLQWMVDFNQEFAGRDALVARWQEGLARVPVCWTGAQGEHPVPAPGAEVLVDGTPVGAVSHAVWSPTLQRTIGTARVDRAVAAAGLDFTLADPAHRIRTASAPFLVATSFGVPLE